MRQLHIREPWADLAAGNAASKVEDFVARIQILENRVRQLEARLEAIHQPNESKIENKIEDKIPVGV